MSLKGNAFNYKLKRKINSAWSTIKYAKGGYKEIKKAHPKYNYWMCFFEFKNE